MSSIEHFFKTLKELESEEAINNTLSKFFSYFCFLIKEFSSENKKIDFLSSTHIQLINQSYFLHLIEVIYS